MYDLSDDITQSTYVSNIGERHLAASQTGTLSVASNMEDLSMSSVSGSLPTFTEDSIAPILPDVPTHEPSGKSTKSKSKKLKVKGFSKALKKTFSKN